MKSFKAACNKVEDQFGCKKGCLKGCYVSTKKDHGGWEEYKACVEGCHCGKGVVNIKKTKVNTFSVIKEEYGDLNQLSEEDMENIDDALAQF